MVTYLGCFHILTIVNNVLVNIVVHKYFLISVFAFSDKFPGVELLDHMVVLFLVFWEISILFFRVPAIIYIPTNSAQVFLLLQILTNTFYVYLDLLLTF